MEKLTEEEYRKLWRESYLKGTKATVSVRVFTPEGKEGYADLTRGVFIGELSIEEFARALKTFLPNLLPGGLQ